MPRNANFAGGPIKALYRNTGELKGNEVARLPMNASHRTRNFTQAHPVGQDAGLTRKIIGPTP